MARKPTYEELETRVRELEAVVSEREDGDHDVIRALSESFQQLADLSQDAIYLFDIESGTFPFFNKRFLDLYEIEENGRKVLSSGSAAQYIHPEDREKLRTARARTLEAGGTQGDVEYRYVHPDGTTRWMHDRWSVVRNRRNKAVAIEGFIRDNTQKKQAEEELEHSRNSALIGSYILQDQRFRYVNPEFCRITGYSGEELIGMRSIRLVHEEYREHVRENALRMLTGQRTTPYEFCVVDSGGRVKWVMETITSVKHKGKRAALGYFMDITKQKQIEKERRDKDRLVAILEMAGAVSHELNSPLQVILTSSEKLGVANLASPLGAKLVALISKNTRRMMAISSKIQSISQYASKDYVDGKRIFDFDEAAKPLAGRS